jgi:hypothetical protein
MEKQAALQIVQALAQGIDPHSGETFPAASPYQHPDTIRALFKAAQALAESPSERTRSPQGAPENAGKPWSEEEDQLLAAAFDSGKAIPELAEQHRRTRVAIQARLVRLGKIEPPADGPRFRSPPMAPTHAKQ